MSLKNSNLDKNILNIGSQILGMKAADADNILGVMKDIGNGEDLAKALVLGGITDKDILANIAKQTDLVDSFDDLTDMMDSFADSQKGLKGTGNALKTIGQNALNAVGGVKMLLGSLSLIGIVVGAIALDDFLHVDYGEAHEAMDEAQSKYDETTSSLEDLRSEAETTTSRIKELEELQASDGLSLVEENELNTLKAQNEELKRQIKLKEELQEAQGKQLANSAKEAMDKGTHSVAQSVKMGDSTGESNFRGDVKDTTDQQEVQNSINLIEQYKSKVAEIEKSIAEEEQKIAEQKDKFTAEQYKNRLKQHKEELKHYEDSIQTLYANIDTRAASMQDNLDALKLDPEANVEEIKELEEALFAIEAMDLDDVGKALKKVENYFDGSLTSSTIKQKIIQMEDFQDGTIDASDALSLFGLTLEDLGITGAHSKQIFNDYFDDFRSDAKQAEKAAKAVEGSLSSIQTASESANDDATWSTVTELFESAKELYDKKKFGTDDFQEMAQFIAPEDAKLDVTKGDIKADDYIELWDKYYKNFKKYFDSENPLKAAVNAQNKLVSEGLGKKGSDGIIRWTDEFRSSAQVADALGVSLEAAEVIMDNLASHGAEFTYEVEEGGKTVTKEMFRAGEAIGDYESALAGMQSVYEQLDDDNPFKKELKTSIEASEKELEGFKEDVGSLKNEKPVIEIQFKYSLAQLESEIQQLENAYENSGKADDLGALVAKKQDKQDLLLTHDNKKDIAKSEDYQVLEASLKQWSNELMSNTNLDEASRKELLQQKNSILELMNTWTELYDVTENPITWDKFINSKDAKDALDQIEQETKLSKDEILDLLSEIENSDFFKDGEYKKKVTVETSTPKSTNPGAETGSEKMDGVVVTFDAKLNKDRVEKELNELKEGQRIEFYAEGKDGLDHLVQAFKDGNGEIHYEVVVDGEFPQEIDWDEERYINFSSTGSEDVQEEADKTKKYIDKVPKDVLTKFYQNGASSVMKDATDVANSVGTVPLSPTIKFNTSGVENTLTALGRIWNKIIQIEDNDNVTVTTRATGGGGYKGTVHHKGTAHAWGINNKIPEDALTNNNYRTQGDDVALTGELGREIVVHGDKWWTVGENGAEFTHIPSNSIVFNHKQTEELLGKGKTKSRGKVHAHGTAFLEGNAYGGMPDLTTPNKINKSGKTTKKSTTVNTTDKSEKQIEKALKKIDKYFDWIEIRFDKLAQASENAKNAIERAGKLSGKYGKLSETDKAINAVRKEQKGVQAGRDEYKKKANSVARKVGLSKTLQKRVQDGTIKISEYGETTQNKINAYKEWWDKYEDANNKLLDLKDEELELALSRFDLIQEWYDAEQDIHDSMIERNQSKLDLRDAKGYSATSEGAKKILEDNLSQAKKKKYDVVSERDKYQAEIKRQLKNGTLKEGTLDYKEAQAELNRLNAAVNEASIEVIEHADALRQIKYDKLNNAIAKFERAADRIQRKIDLAEARDKKVSESTYKSQMAENNKTIENKYELRKKKLFEQSKYAVNSKKYQEIADEINTIDKDITSLLIENENIKDNIFESRFAPLEEGVEELQNVRSELDDFRSLFNEEAFFDTKTGGLTGEGVANIYLIEEAMIAAKQEIADYSKGLEKLEENYENGNISQEEFNEKSEEYRQGIRNATSDIKEYSDTLVDLYLTQMNKENELLQETISLRKEALQRKAEYYDYDKNIRNQTKDINALKAQAAALEMSNDAASKAELKRLRQEIADAEEELSETKRSHSIDMQEQGYDALSQDLNDVLKNTETEIKSNADKQLEVIDSMLQQTVSKYAEAYKSINNIISQTGFVGSSDFNGAVDGVKTEEKAESQADKALQAQSKVSAEQDVKDIKIDKIEKQSDISNHNKIENALNTPEKTTNRPVAEVVLSKSTLTIEEGKSKKVTATVRPTDAKNRNLRWQSSNTKIATVSGGTIKAKKAGSCTITAIAIDGSKKKDSVKVTVTAKPKNNDGNKNGNNGNNNQNGNKNGNNNGNNNSNNSTSGGNGKITKGEKVIFASGKYTAASDGSGATGNANLGKSVYVQKIKSGAKRPYLITRDKAGKRGLGWVSKSQLKGYASGSKYIPEEQLAWTQEQGSELITLPDGSVLTKLPKGSGVIPHNLTENLWNLARSSDDIMSKTASESLRYVNNVSNNGGNKVTYHYDSLLTVNGDVDKATLPELKEILQQAYQYTSQQMTKDALKAGYKLRR